MRAVLPLWQSVQRRGKDPAQLAQRTGCSLAQLTDPKQRISWAAYCQLLKNLGAMFDEAELVVIGGEALDSAFVRALALPVRYLFGAVEAYRWFCAPSSPVRGLFAQTDPHFTQLGPARVRLSFVNGAGYASSHENFLLLEGVLVAVGTAMSGKPARVTRTEAASGAMYDIELAEAHGLVGAAARRVVHPVTSRLRRVALLERAQDELLGRYAELEREVNARIVTETELRRSEEQYRQLFERAPIPMWVFDAETLRFLEVNDAAVEHYGYSRDELLGMTILDIRPPEDVPDVIALIRQDSESPRVWRHRKRDGSTILVEITAHSVISHGRRARIVHANDVTARQHRDEQAGAAQRMLAVGQLAGGIAHDFNNLLGVIINTCELALRGSDVPARTGDDLRAIQSAAQRGADLTRRLLTFSQRQLLRTPQLVDVSDVLREMQPLLTRAVTERVRIALRASHSVTVTCVGQDDLERVILNLVVNASDAMPEGGTITLAANLIELDATAAAARGCGRPGAYVVIAVTDTGHGIDHTTIEHIFEPNFTTKPDGHGTGLGLSNVMAIVDQAGGHVRVDSTVGSGTRFELYLPADKIDLDASVR